MSVNFKTHSHPNDTSKQQHESKEPGCYKSCTLKHPHNPLLNHDRICQIMARLQRLTLPYLDQNGNMLQLWKIQPSQLIGTVQNIQQLKIIPGYKIRLLSEELHPNDIIQKLEKEPLKRWDISYDSRTLGLNLWPHMIGGGKDWFIEVNKSPYKEMTKEEIIQQLKNEGFVFNGNKNTGIGDYINVKTGEKAYIDPRAQGDDREPNHVDFTAPDQPKVRLYYKDEFGLKIYRKQTELRGKQLRVLKGTKAVAEKQFYEILNKTGLTKSYQATHPKNPIPARGGSGGSIGGVGNDVGIIEGLFETAGALEETEHDFYIPSREGKMPFSQAELQQLLRELALGIYVHETTPFFSLHFNSDTNMYPVIHPVYEHTLVGRVISLLDYYMKGFLSGGFFVHP